MGDGSKSVKVGSRIAVFADPEDDIQSLEIPAEESAPEPKKEKSTASQSKDDDPKEKPPEKSNEPSRESKKATKGGPSGAAPRKQGTLLPSVLHLLKEKGLSKEDADKIPASGPSGRLLKGDVLAYLGRIEESYAAEQSQRIAKLGHLDLSNIKVVTPPAKKDAGKEAAKDAGASPKIEDVRVDVRLSISLAAVLSCQKRVEDSLGIYLPTATFIARAVDIANENLPPSKASKPSADELFNAILGLDKVAGPKGTKGRFVPQITALPVTNLAYQRPGPAAKPDIIDVLAGSKTASVRQRSIATAPGSSGLGGAVNMFSVNVPKGQEKRAAVFLERVKTVLEVEPGSLVL